MPRRPIRGGDNPGTAGSGEHCSVRDVIRTGSAGLLLMTTGHYLAWLALELLERLPCAFLRPLPVDFRALRYRSGFVARRAAEDLAPLRRLESLVREAALGRTG